MLEEQGSNFSGGQRQRLAIARALLHDTPMYIFDEAASNIDVESEDQIMEVIRELAKTKTILFISHRLANVVASDQIYMLENGQITESGTHGELMKKSRKLCKYVSETAGIVSGKGGKSMKRRSGIQIMGKLIGLIRPLMHVMAAAILLGVTGYLCAIFLTVLAGVGILQIMGIWQGASLTTLFVCLAVIAVLRGILHYGEQACNHYIAFKLLALIRHKVFAVLRKLCPAKLDGRDKGNLISIITTDIELLEVFYAHTISPIAIAFLTSLIMEIFFFRYHVRIGLFALGGISCDRSSDAHVEFQTRFRKGMEFRTRFGDLNSFVLDSLRGLDETIQYGCGEKREEQMERKSVELDAKQKEMKKLEGTQRGGTNVLILIFSFGMLFLTTWLHQQGEIGFDAVLLCTILMMSSFGPVVALSSLSNNLMQTLAKRRTCVIPSGRRTAD